MTLKKKQGNQTPNEKWGTYGFQKNRRARRPFWEALAQVLDLIYCNLYQSFRASENAMKNVASSASVSPASALRPRRLLDQVRDRIRVKHYALRTEQTYVDWIKRYILYFGKQHPASLSAGHVERFLSHLASERNVAASTQNQAKSALLFLYKEVLGVELPWLDDITQAKTPKRLPVVLTRDEFARGEIIVREGKGFKDRVTMLPRAVADDLRSHFNAGREWAWQYVFPAAGRSTDPHRAGVARPFRCVHHDDLHARPQQGRARGGESARWLAAHVDGARRRVAGGAAACRL